ncbi:MAG: ribosome assembly RNA-binding protein YhbY [Proteobacteria bacterium]|nr:ribosome assembly RNA-binding protein YhbY [Pseudomonadota bacterium]
MEENLKKLTGKQARYLRGLGHSLKPILQVGKGGITDSFVHQVRSGLETHELIKVKLIKSAPESAKDAAEMLVSRVPCQLAQLIGKTLLLYKRRQEKPSIVLPEG